MLFEVGQKIVLIGDSITDAERRGRAAPHGDGYVRMVRNFLIARYPQLGLTLLNRGVGGNTTRDLAERWDQDVLAERPDWLSVCIGINDVWRLYGDAPYDAVPLPEYTATLHRLLGQAQASGARLIVMEPYMIESDRREPMRHHMDMYSAAVQELAVQHEAILVRTQAAFDAVLEYTPSTAWSDDQIHPNEPGYAVIALAWLRAVGFELG